MTDIFDGFKKAAFGDIEFPYVSLGIKGSLRHHVHEVRLCLEGDVELQDLLGHARIQSTHRLAQRLEQHPDRASRQIRMVIH